MNPSTPNIILDKVVDDLTDVLGHIEGIIELENEQGEDLTNIDLYKVQTILEKAIGLLEFNEEL